MRGENWPKVFAQVQHFLSAADRLAWFVALGCPESVITLTPTLAEDIDTLVDDATACVPTCNEWKSLTPSAIESSRFDICKHPQLLRLVLTDSRLSGLRRRKVRLVSALERGCDASVVTRLLEQVNIIAADDRERSYMLLTAFQQKQQECKYDPQQITAWLECFPSNSSASQDQTTPKTSLREECIASRTRRVSVGGDPRRRDLLHELTRACEENDLERVGTLLPEYSCLNADADDGHAWHPRLLKLAIDHRHLTIVELLLRCDLRGRVVRIEELLAALQPMSPRANTNLKGDALDYTSVSTAVVDILTEKEPLYTGLMWDAAALDQAVDTNDQRLLHFLLEYVDLSQQALKRAHSRSISADNTAFAASLSSAISALKWRNGESTASDISSTLSLPQFEYKEGERVSAQFAGGIHFWTGTIHRCWLNGTYDVRVTEYSESPVEARVPASALRPLLARKLVDVRRSVIASVAQSTVDRVITTAANGVRERSRIQHPLREGDDSDDSEEDDDESDESECDSDCDCGCESGSSSDLVSDSDDSSSDGEPSSVSALSIPKPSDLSADPLCNMPETDDEEHAICLDAAEIEGLTTPGVIEDNPEQQAEHERDQEICMPESAAAEGATFDAPASPSPSANVESTVATEMPLGELDEERIHAISTPTAPNRILVSTAASPTPSPGVISCAVAWTSSTVDLAQLSELQVGDRVDVRFRGREPWLRGRIAQCHRGKLAFDVAYDDGEFEEEVVREYIKLVTDMTGNEAACEAPVESSASNLAGPPPETASGEVNDSRDTPGDSDEDADNVARDTPVNTPASPLTDPLLDVVTASSEPAEPAEVISVDPAADDGADDSSPNGSRVASYDPTATRDLSVVDEPAVQKVAAAPLLVTAPTTSDGLRVEPEHRHLRYHPGQEIEANFLGIGKFHPARIVRVHANNEAYDVAFSEFDQTELRVLPVNIRPPRASTRRIKALLKGPSSSVMPLETVTSKEPPANSSSDGNASDSSRSGGQSSPQLISSKLDEMRRPSNSPLVAPLSASVIERPQASRTSRTSSNSSSRASTLRREDGRAQGRPRTHNRAAISSHDVEEWRNVDIILNRKRRLLNAPTGNVESTRVPWGEEFASIQSLKRFATQHPDVLRDHIVSQLGELGIQRMSPTRSSPSPTRATSQTRMTSARETLLMIKDLAFLLHQRLSPFFDVIVPVVLPAVFSSDRRFLCDTAYEVLEALVLHCSGRKLALALLQQGAHFNSQENFRLLNLTSVYVEKCFGNFSAAEIAALAASERSKSTTTIAQLLTLLLGSKSIPTRIAIEKSLLRIRRELGERRFEVFLRTNLEPAKAESILLSDKFNTAVSNTPPPTSKSPRKHQRSDERSCGGATEGNVAAYQSPSILQRMLQQRYSRVRPSPSHA